MKQIALALIEIYQMTISKVLPSACRFTPTCSQYTHEAISKYGIMKGIWLGTKRLSRCHPLNSGGYDPIPR